MLNKKRDISSINLTSTNNNIQKVSNTNGTINVLQNESLLCEIDQNYYSSGVVKLERLVAVNDNPQPLDKFVSTNLNLKNFEKTFIWEVKKTKLTKLCTVGLGIKEVIKDNNYNYGIADSKHKGKESLIMDERNESVNNLIY